jgi:hypothetical protein
LGFGGDEGVEGEEREKGQEAGAECRVGHGEVTERWGRSLQLVGGWECRVRSGRRGNEEVRMPSVRKGEGGESFG